MPLVILSPGYAPSATRTPRPGDERLPDTTALDAMTPSGSTPHAIHVLTATDTLLSLSDDYFGAYDAWRSIAEDNGIRSWGMATPLTLMPGLSVGSRIRIPSLGGES